jgi:hypothetical protein
MRKTFHLALLAVALSGACGGSDTKDEGKALEEACIAVCDKAYNPSCGGLTVEQCKSGCGLLETQLGGACVPEYTDFYNCAAGVEFECTANGPQPVGGAGCYTETQALSQCIQEMPCRSYCAKKSACDGSDETACVSACQATVDGNGSCDHDLENLRQCQGQQGLVCEGGKARTVGCTDDIKYYASCLSGSEGACGGYCWAVETAACGSASPADCKSACETEQGKAEAKGCGSYFSQRQACQIEHGIPCDGGKPSIAGCSEEDWTYRNCLESN